METWLLWYTSTAVLALVALVGDPSIGRKLFPTEALAAAVTVGALGSTWLAFLSSAYFAALTTQAVWIAWGVLAGVAALRLPGFFRNLPGLMRRSSLDDAVALAILGLISLILWPTYNGRMIPSYGEQLVTGGSCYGDLPIHMTIANSFLVGCNTEVKLSGMMSPIFAGRDMTYPFLPDFHAAVIVALGGSMRDGFLLPGFSLASALWVLLFWLGVRVTRSRLGAALGVALVIGAGGLGMWRWLEATHSANPDAGWLSAWNTVVAQRHDVVQHDYTGEWKYLWFAFVPHIMLPQRGANFAYPMTVLVLIFVWIGSDTTTTTTAAEAAPPALPPPRSSSTPSSTGRGGVGALAGAAPGSGAAAAAAADRTARRTFLIGAAVLAATLPMFQAHAFIGAGIIIGVIALLDAPKWLADPHLLVSWALAGVAAAALGYPQVAQFRRTVEEGFYGNFLTYGWVWDQFEFGEPHGSILGFLRFWFYSLGPAVDVFLAAGALYAFEAAIAWRRGSLAPPQHQASTGVAGLLARLGVSADAANALSPGGGRSWDAFKLGLGALAVFAVSNYINFQPWIRDNAKIYYVFIFVSAPLGGALLAAPFEYLAGAGPGLARINFWLSVCGLAPAAATAAEAAAVGLPVPAGLKSKASDDDDGSLAAGRAGAGGGVQRGGGGVSRRAAGGAAAQAAPLSSSGKAAAGGAEPSRRRAGGCGGRGCIGLLVAALGCAVAPPLFALSVGSGLTLLYTEYLEAQGVGQGILIDSSCKRMGEWVKANVPKQAVILHSNYHVQPTLAIAGRPSLVAYFGWISNHGYNGNDRLGDRDYIMDNALKDSDEKAYFLCRRWGVRYILGHYMRKHPRAPGTPPDLYLDGKLRRVHTEGGYELFEVDYSS